MDVLEAWCLLVITGKVENIHGATWNPKTYKRLANNSIDTTTAYDRIRLPHVQEKAGFRQMEFGISTGWSMRVRWSIQSGKATMEMTVRQSMEIPAGD